MPIRIERTEHGYTLHIGYRTDVRVSDDEANMLHAALSDELSPAPYTRATPAKARLMRYPIKTASQ